MLCFSVFCRNGEGGRGNFAFIASADKRWQFQQFKA